MLPLRSHLTRKRGVYYYRRILSGSPRREFALSLGTRRFREAEHLAGLLDDTYKRTIATMTNQADLSAILKQVLREAMEADKAEIHAGRSDPYWVRSLLIGGPPVGDKPAIQHMIEAKERAELDYGSRNVKAVASAVKELCARFGVPDAQAADLAHGLLYARAKIARQLLEREVRGLGVEIAQLDSPDPPAYSAAPLAPPSREPEREAINLGPLLSAAVDSFKREKTKEQVEDKTLDQYVQSYKLFLGICPDKPIGAYTRTDVSEFYDVLTRLPSRYCRSPRWRGVTLREISERADETPEDKPLTMKTVQRHFSPLIGLFDEAIRRGYRKHGDNPAKGWNFDRFRGNGEARAPWPLEDLKQLAASPIWRGRHAYFMSRPGPIVVRDAHFWLPIIALYQGMRQNEIAQLVRRDIKCEGGIDFFDIAQGDGQSLKTKAAARKVPFHPMLGVLGFAEYVGEVATRPTDPLFPGLSRGATYGRKNDYFTKQFGAYRKAIGVRTKYRDFHAFRHNFTTSIREGGVSDAIAKQLIGHTDSEVIGRYTGRFSLESLAEAVAKVSYPGVNFASPDP